MCSPSLNKYSSVIYVCAFAEREREREREVAKKSVWMFNECLHESSLSSSASSANEKRLFHIFSFFQPLRLFTFFTCEKAFRPKWPRPSSCEAKSDTSQIYSFQSGESVSGNSPTQTPKRARFSFSLSLGSNHKQRREEGTERSLSLSLDGVVFFALLLRLFRARREFARLEKRKRRKKKKREEEDDDYSTECDDEGREHQRGGEKDIRLRPTLG